MALTLIIAAAGAVAPTQAARLIIEKGPIEMGSDHRDCDSRSEVRYFFQSEYDLKHVSVSRTHDYFIYKVSGYNFPMIEKAPVALREIPTEDFPSGKLSKHDDVRYVYLFDACDHRVIKQLQPRD